MRIKLLLITLFAVLSCTILQAQPADELIRKNLTNLSIPNENIKTFSVDLIISSSGSNYLSQVRYDNGNMAFNCFDTDKTPLLIARNGNVIYNDALNTRICLLRKNILIAKAVFEGDQMNATINFHQPNDEEKENAIKIDFLSLAEQAMSKMRTSKENGIITVTGETSKQSKVTSVIKPGDFFPLKKFSISSFGDDFVICFDNIRVNEEVDKKCFVYPEKELAKSNITLNDLTDLTDELSLSNFGMLQRITYSVMVRSAFDDKEMQEKLEEILKPSEKINWSQLKASDVLKSARLRTLFKAF
ncbi:MAG: hypothetical protein II961_04335 [Candidatus Riflebacteria bacterium]|nr:hypothetical protein [Candidatus Riflebacteria bacterium]